MKERHLVCLTDEARFALSAMLQSGVHRARVLRRAQVLLKSDEGLVDSEICEHTGVSERSIRAIRQRYCRQGLERAIYDAPRSGKPPEFTERQQKQVIALACTDPPEGRARWTLTLLAEEAVKRGIVTSLSKSEVALWLTAADLKPWQKKDGAFRDSRRSSASAWKTCSINTNGLPAFASR
jgi:putative transposase